MAELILETGAGLVNSNSYADLAYADAYFASHPYHADAWANITDEDRREALLISASTFLDVNYVWYGYRTTTTQAMEWPRTGVYTDTYTMIPEYTVPDRVRRAACEQAFFMSKGDPNAPQAGVGITELKVDVIELKFDKSVTTSSTSSAVMDYLRGLAEYAYGRRIRKVLVG